MPFLRTEKSQVFEILSYIVNIMGADVLPMQGTRASTTMIFTMVNRINSVPAR